MREKIFSYSPGGSSSEQGLANLIQTLLKINGFPSCVTSSGINAVVGLVIALNRPR